MFWTRRTGRDEVLAFLSALKSWTYTWLSQQHKAISFPQQTQLNNRFIHVPQCSLGCPYGLKAFVLFHKHFPKDFESLALWSPFVLNIQAHECHYCTEGRLLSLFSVGLQLLCVKYCPHSKANWLPPLAWSAVWGYSFSPVFLLG